MLGFQHSQLPFLTTYLLVTFSSILATIITLESHLHHQAQK